MEAPHIQSCRVIATASPMVRYGPSPFISAMCVAASRSASYTITCIRAKKQQVKRTFTLCPPKMRHPLVTIISSNRIYCMDVRSGLLPSDKHKVHCTGWKYRSESTTSSARLSTVVCSARLRHTWRISAYRSPILPAVCSIRSAATARRSIARHRRTQFGRWAFSVAGPMAWNALPDSIRDTALSICSFRRHLKTLLFSFY